MPDRLFLARRLDTKTAGAIGKLGSRFFTGCNINNIKEEVYE